MNTHLFRRYNQRRLYRMVTMGSQYTPIPPVSEAVRVVELGEQITLPESMTKFDLQYRACFPHCTTKLFDKESPTANLTFPVHPELTVRQLVDLSWTRLRKICYKNPTRNIERAVRVRLSINGVSMEGRPRLGLDLDAEGICCQEVENLTLGGGVWESVFSRFKAQDAGIRYWEL
ncbi:hypothetical protein TWF730_002560 [Orbilia blumenaviensis]|uniref:Uncharacterized protein n=1 Tax=Orbilia blumenaviensis TaxID=1796055 RepID=A0AAV9UEP3_9PEZI